MKKYIKPATQIHVMAVTSMVCMSIPTGDEKDNPIAETRGCRGIWGNLWYDGEQEEHQ